MAIAQKAADGATGDHRGHIGAERFIVDAQAGLALVGGTRLYRQGVGLVAGDQRLATAQVDVVVAVTLLHRYTDQLVELAHGFAACVQQAVGRVAGAAGRGDLLVVFGDAAGELVDLPRQRIKLGVDHLVLLAQLGGHRIEAVAQGLRLGQQQLPRGDITGLGRCGLQGREECGKDRADTGVAVGQQLVDAGDLVLEGDRVGLQRGGGLQLVVQVGTIDAAHIRQRGTGPQEPRTDIVRRARCLNRLLPRIATGSGVGDVVTGYRQCRLAGAQATQADGNQARHDLVLL